MKKPHLYSNKLTWQQRREIAHKAYRPSNNKFALDVRKLRVRMFGRRNRVPLDCSMSARLEVFNTHGDSLGLQTIFVNPSKSVGDKKTRGGRGHRLFILCPACGIENKIPVGRLHQHYGYKHEEVK